MTRPKDSGVLGLTMTAICYGTWDGAVFDHRYEAADAGVVPALVDFEFFDKNNHVRAFFGDRGFFVFDPTVSLIDGLWRQMISAAEQSCGKCTPCRMGTILIRDALDALRRGERTLSLADIEVLAEQMTATSMCGLGQTCARSLLAALAQLPRRHRG